MAVLHAPVDPSDETYRENRAALLALLSEHEEQLDLVRAGGGPRYVERHRERGKLLVRERIELLSTPTAPSSSSRLWPPTGRSSTSGPPSSPASAWCRGWSA